MNNRLEYEQWVKSSKHLETNESEICFDRTIYMKIILYVETTKATEMHLVPR